MVLRSSSGCRAGGRYFHSASMTFAHYQFAAGSSIHEHFHPEEEVYEVIEGELEVTIDGRSRIAKPGVVAIVPANSRALRQSIE
jgi:quercetin dioxygenase-like cupin family protein